MALFHPRIIAIKTQFTTLGQRGYFCINPPPPSSAHFISAQQIRELKSTDCSIFVIERLGFIGGEGGGGGGGQQICSELAMQWSALQVQYIATSSSREAMPVNNMHQVWSNQTSKNSSPTSNELNSSPGSFKYLHFSTQYGMKYVCLFRL